MVVPKLASRDQQPSIICGGAVAAATAAGRSDSPIRRRKRPSNRNQVVLAATLALLFAASVIMSVFLVVTGPSTNSLRSSLSFNQQQSAAAATTATNLHRHLPSSDGTYDIIILGRGPAGLSAALFSARSGLSVLVLGSGAGALSQAVTFDNFPSWQSRSTSAMTSDESVGGPGWLATSRIQAEQAGATFAPPGLLATNIEMQNQLFVVDVPNSSTSYRARSVIIATGSSPRRLDLPHEAALWGRSLHSCAICDGSQYSGKTVLVIGGGDAAVDGALILARRSKKVYLVHRREEWRASDAANILAMGKAKNIEVLTPYVVKEWIVGTGNIFDGAILSRVGGSDSRELQIDGAFIMIGSVPNTKWLQSASALIQLSRDGHIPVDENLMADIPGIFASGEVADERYRQAIVAASDGAKAAIEAERWLRSTAGIAQNHAAKAARPADIDLVAAATKKDDSISSSTISWPAVHHTEHRTDDWSEDKDDANPEDCDLTNLECIKTVVSRHPVVVFSKPWCPYCRRALEALGLDGAAPHVIDLSRMQETHMIQSTLEEMTGRRTVPNVFIGGTSIGGGDETLYLQRSGKLKSLLDAAGAFS